MNPLNLDDTLQVRHTEYFGSLAEAPDIGWIENVRLGTLQLAGCAAALVSADGLAVTSATCLRSLETWIRPGDSLFVADELSQEYKLAGLTVRQLTDLRKIDSMEDVSGAHVDVIASDDSSYFWEYTWRIYDDMRLVLIPPVELANFRHEDGVYPRHAVNFALFRVYDENDQPLDGESYFAWSDRSPHHREKLYATAFNGDDPFTRVTLSDTFDYNGTISPPFTTLYGMLDLHYSHGETGRWALPAKWSIKIKESDLSAPLNFSVAGECAQMGAAIVDVDMEILGISFDDAHTQGGNRCVAVSTSGILSLIRTTFNAKNIAEELAEQTLGGNDELQ